VLVLLLLCVCLRHAAANLLLAVVSSLVALFGFQLPIPGPKAPAAPAVFGHHGLLSGPRLPPQFHRQFAGSSLLVVLPYLLSFYF